MSLGVERAWRLSRRLSEHGALGDAAARIASKAVFFVYRADLPRQCSVGDGLVLLHGGQGVVINPSVTIGRNVRILHNVTIGVATKPGAPSGHVVIEDDVGIGAGAIILAPAGTRITIGAGAKIGAAAYVRTDVPAGGRAFAPTADIRPAPLEDSE